MSQQDKNCQIPTPVKYVEQMLDYVGYKFNLCERKVLENSCGEGNILIEIVRRYITDAKNNKYTPEEIVAGLEKNVVAYEIDPQKIDICKKRLNKLAFKEDLPEVRWNIKRRDFLKSREKNVDFIIGNPPYITYHDLTENERKILKKNFTVCKKGRFDYCYAFIEASIKTLAPGGKMIYLVPFSIFRNKFANGLRAYLRDYITEIVDYRNIDVFPGITCSTSLILCENLNVTNQIKYRDIFSQKTFLVDRSALGKDGQKWIFYSANSGKRRFGDYFSVQNSVATLCNRAYIFVSEIEDSQYYFVKGMPVEKKITLPAISTKSCRTSKKGKGKVRIIFPYKLKKGKIVHYTEEEFENQYPKACSYLHQFDDDLDKRKSDEKAKWFEYGRSQALADVFNQKLIIPMVITHSTRTYIAGKKTIPFAGYFITVNQNSSMTLKDAKKALESTHFYEYVEEVGTPTTLSSYRVSVHDISGYMF